MAFSDLSPVLSEVITELQDHNVGVFGTSIFATSQSVLPPDSVDGAFLKITETGGVAPLRRQNDGHSPAYARPTIQIIGVGSTYRAAFDLLKAAYDVLLAVENKRLSGTLYLYITPRQEITDIGLDETGSRAQVDVNFDIFKEQSQ